MRLARWTTVGWPELGTPAAVAPAAVEPVGTPAGVADRRNPVVVLVAVPEPAALVLAAGIPVVAAQPAGCGQEAEPKQVVGQR